MLKTEGINTVEDIIIISSLVASKSVSDEWTKVTGEDQMSWKSSFAVRLEMLYFFLHMMSRYAFPISQEARATLQDELVPRTIQRLIKTSFDRSKVKKGVNVKVFDAEMVSSALEEYNEAEIDYSSCKRLGIEDKVGSSSEETILNKLVWRINRSTGHEFTINLEFLVWKAAVESLAKSELKEKVRKLIDRGD